MTVNRTTLLDLPLPVSGTESGTWGDTTNNGLTQYLDIAIAGMSNLTSANFTAGALTIETTEGTNLATNIVATSAQYAGFRVSSLAVNSTITVGNTGTTLGRSYRLINADSTYTLTFKATGQTGVTLQPGQSAVVAFNGTDYVFVGAAGPVSLTTPLTVVGNATAGAEIRLPEDTDNGSNYVALKAADNLASNLTFTLPSVDGTNGQVLQTNGSGTLSFTSQTSLATPLAVVGNSSAGAEIRLPEDTDNGSNYVALKAADNLASNLTFTLPSADGTSGQPIITNGSGTLSFGTLTGTGAFVRATTPVITALQEKSAAIAASAIDLATANYFTKTISGTTTFTVSNVASSGDVTAFILILTNGGSATVNWFSGVTWNAGTAPTLTSSGVDILGFFTINGGTTWRGLVLAKAVA